MLDNQKILDNAWKFHLVKRNPLGFDLEKNTCTYLGINGQRCAIGCQIPRHLLINIQLKDNPSIAALVLEIPNIRRLFKDSDTNFLIDLQRGHDAAAKKEHLWLEGKMVLKYNYNTTNYDNLEKFYRVISHRHRLETLIE